MEIPKDQKETTFYAPEFVHVRFTTTTFPKKCTDKPFKVPSHLTRFGLSEIVNDLLGNEVHVPFEFLIRYKNRKIFLRTSLQRFYVLTQNWPEEIDVLEYVEAQPAPKDVDEIPHDDWIRCIQHLASVDHSTDYLVSGAYDGAVRVIDENSGTILAQHKHPRSITSVDCRRMTNPNNLLLVSSCLGEKLHLYHYDASEKKFFMRAILRDHESKVNCVRFSYDGSLIYSASHDKAIRIYSSNPGQPDQNAKRRKLEEYKSIDHLSGHYLGVTCLEVKNNVELISGGDDHTVRIWDITTRQIASTIQGSKVVSSLSFNPEHNVILTSHPDHAIRMWDSRASDANANVFRSHKGWVRSVDWAKKQGSSYQFVSGGDDNLIKIWDIRSAIPIHSFSHHKFNEEDQEKKEEEEKEDEEFKKLDSLVAPLLHKKRARANWKTFSVTYAQGSSNILYSGGSDCVLKKHKI